MPAPSASTGHLRQPLYGEADAGTPFALRGHPRQANPRIASRGRSGSLDGPRLPDLVLLAPQAVQDLTLSVQSAGGRAATAMGAGLQGSSWYPQVPHPSPGVPPYGCSSRS